MLTNIIRFSRTRNDDKKKKKKIALRWQQVISIVISLRKAEDDTRVSQKYINITRMNKNNINNIRWKIKTHLSPGVFLFHFLNSVSAISFGVRSRAKVLAKYECLWCVRTWYVSVYSRRRERKKKILKSFRKIKIRRSRGLLTSGGTIPRAIITAREENPSGLRRSRGYLFFAPFTHSRTMTTV